MNILLLTDISYNISLIQTLWISSNQHIISKFNAFGFGFRYNKEIQPRNENSNVKHY